MVRGIRYPRTDRLAGDDPHNIARLFDIKDHDWNFAFHSQTDRIRMDCHYLNLRKLHSI